MLHRAMNVLVPHAILMGTPPFSCLFGRRNVGLIVPFQLIPLPVLIRRIKRRSASVCGRLPSLECLCTSNKCNKLAVPLTVLVCAPPYTAILYFWGFSTPCLSYCCPVGLFWGCIVLGMYNNDKVAHVWNLNVLSCRLVWLACLV